MPVPREVLLQTINFQISALHFFFKQATSNFSIMSKIPNMMDLNALKGAGTSDLMSRLNSFLPELAAANKKLNETEGGSTSAQIDVSLQKDDDNDNADDSVSSDANNDNVCAADGKQTIQMTVALKNFDDPIFSLLTNEDNEEDLPVPPAGDEVEVNESETNRAVISLIGNEQNTSSVEQEPLFTVRSTRRKDGSS